MEDVGREPALETLTAELSWLRRLAIALVRDEHAADDLVQETWLVAAERAPTDGRPLRPWLGRVALNVVRMESRAAKRRRARESAAEPVAAALPTPAELVLRVEAQRIVVDQVLQLAEPYRSTVLLRFFEELSSAEIARRLGLPEGTVRRRLKVALDELRRRLHATERKTGRAVLAVLASLAVTHSATSVGRAALGVVLVKKILAAIVVVAGLVLVGARLYSHHTSPAAPDEPPRALGSGAPPTQVTRLPAPPRIAIAVTDAAGPLANAIVRCAPADGEVVVGTTASDGSAVLALAPGRWSIAASAEGHEPAATTLDVVAARDARLQLVLAPGGRALTGTVTDATGGPIAGARIDAAPLRPSAKVGPAVAVAISDAAGHYKLTLGGGAILVAASHPDYAPQSRYVDLGATGATASFALVPGGVIEGVVRDDHTQQPVPGATVRADVDASPMELAEWSDRAVTADGAGKFRFTGLRPGAYSLSARSGARGSRAPVGIGLGVAEQQTDVLVRVGAMATVRGKVVDESGAPAGGVTVRALGGGVAEAVADAAGAFVLEGLPPGRWALRGTSEAYTADGAALVPVATSDVAGVVVRVRRGLVVAGHVEPREVCDVELAQPAPGELFPAGDAGTTSADGGFHFAPVAPGKATLVARCPNGDQGSVEVTVSAGGESVIPVAPGGAVAGRVVDASGVPIEGVVVTAEVASDLTTFQNGVVASAFQAITAAGGAFEVRGLGAASYRLGVLERGRPVKAKRAVQVALAAGQRAAGLELVVARSTGTIQGTVTGPDGAPVADAWVALHQSLEDQIAALTAGADAENPDRRVRAEAMPFGGGGVDGVDPPAVLTDARGHFEITSLLRGRYQVVAEARGGALRGRAADVTTDAQITIPLARVSALRGTVHGARGPTDLFSVQLEGPTLDGGAFTQGAFEFPRLDPGNYTVRVTSADGTGSGTAHVASNAAAAIDIALVANGTVSGRVIDKTGKPVSGMRVALIPDQPPGQLRIEISEEPAASGPDGRFQVDGPPGPRTLVLMGTPPTAKRGVAVTSGGAVDVGDVTLEGP